jgi:hypothetical protein
MTLFWHETGPLLKYDGEVLLVEGLNPHISTKWRMSRLEMFQTGLRFLLAAIKGN